VRSLRFDCLLDRQVSDATIRYTHCVSGDGLDAFLSAKVQPEQWALVRERLAALDGLFGFPLSLSSLAAALAQAAQALAGDAARDLLEHVRVLDARILGYERQIQAHVRSSQLAQRAQTLRGVGPLTASAMVASVGEAREFKNGRQFAAWLGLVPRQHSTGGKTRLGQITRSGDGYLRTLLVLGARAVLRRAPHERDPLSRWALALRERRGYHRACVAIAAKNARHVWAALAGRTPALSA